MERLFFFSVYEPRPQPGQPRAGTRKTGVIDAKDENQQWREETLQAHGHRAHQALVTIAPQLIHAMIVGHPGRRVSATLVLPDGSVP